jgi:hypothetical protein
MRESLRPVQNGLITGAASDDPSGIATYSQVGAEFGFAMFWTMLFSFSPHGGQWHKGRAAIRSVSRAVVYRLPRKHVHRNSELLLSDKFD